MSVTRMQEIQICFSKQKQADIATPNTGVQMWQLRKLNAALANPKLNTENDAEEFGKGHEFRTQSFQTSWDVNGTLEKYLGAEIGAWAMAFGLGKVVKSGTTPNFTYTCTPLFPASGDAAELPYFSFVEQIRPGAGVVVDRMAVGCVVEGWTISIGSGPAGRIRRSRSSSWARASTSSHRASRCLRQRSRNSCRRPRWRSRSTASTTSRTRTWSRSRLPGRTTSVSMAVSSPAPDSRRRATAQAARSAAGSSLATARARYASSPVLKTARPNLRS